MSLVLKAIEADNRIEYSEVKFFKKIRSRLSISDEAILGEHPDKEDFLLPDLKVDELPVWDEHAQFAQITIPPKTTHNVQKNKSESATELRLEGVSNSQCQIVSPLDIKMMFLLLGLYIC